MKLSIVCSIALFVASTALAQSSRLTGRVADPQGAAVVNALITLTAGGGGTRTTRSATDGSFAFEPMMPGEYALQIDAPGFIRALQKVTVDTATSAVAVTLQIARVVENIQVVGAAASALVKPSTTGSRLGLTALETPASVQILAGELIRDRGDVVLSEAKSRAVGVASQADPGNGGGGVTARGFVGVGSVMQLWDGEQLFPGASTISFPFDPWTVDRIEVLGGPASVMYGTGAIGGVVNVVPRRPNAVRFDNTANLTAGSQNVFRGAFDTTGPLNDRWSYRFDLSQNTSGGWVDRGDSKSTALSGSIRFQAAPSLNVVLSEDYGYQKPETYFGTPTVNGRVDDSLRRTNFNVGDANILYKDSWTRGHTEWRPSPNVLVRNSLRALNTSRFWYDVEKYTFQPATGLVIRSDYIEIEHHQRQYGDRTEVMLNGGIAGRPNTVSVGGDYNWVRFQHVSNRPFGGSSSVTLIDPTPGNFVNPGVTRPRYETNTQQYSLSVEDRLAVAPQLSLIVGGRFDRYSIDRLDLVSNTTSSRRFTPPSGRAGVVYSPRTDVSVYAQYATANDAVGTFISQSVSQQTFDLTTGRQVEVGVKQSMRNGRAEWTVAGYRIVKNNLVVPTPGNPTVSQQVGQQSSVGAEATVSLMVARGLRLDGNAAFLHARFDDFGETVSGTVISRNGNTPPIVPEQTANLWVTWNGSTAWQVRGGLRYVGERFWNNANTSTAPAFTVVDAGLRRTLTAKLTLDARLYNAFDKLYALTFAGSNDEVPQWMLGRARAVEVSLGVRFPTRR